MDLDDSFTERLLRRNKERKQFKVIKENETPELIAQKRQALIEDQQIRKPGNVSEQSPKRLCEESDDDSPKRQCLELTTGSPSRQWPPPQYRNEQEKENTPMKESFVPFKASLNVKGLAALKRTDNQVSSVIPSELTSQAETNSRSTYVFSTNTNEMCTGRKTRLANLAANINQWEDDLHKPIGPTNSVASLASKFSKDPSNSVLTSDNVVEKTTANVSEKVAKINTNACSNASSQVSSPLKFGLAGNEVMREKSPRKIQVWDQAIKATLEIEDKNSHDVKSTRSMDVKNDCHKIEKVHQSVKPSTNFVKSKLKLFDNAAAVDLNKSFEPSELPLSARKALFERGLSGNGARTKGQAVDAKLSVAERAALFENPIQKSSISKPTPVNYHCKNINSPEKLSPCKSSKVTDNRAQTTPVKTAFTPEKKISPVKFKESPHHSTSPVKKINADTRAVEQMLLARVNSATEMKPPASNLTEKPSQSNAALAKFWEKRTRSETSQSEEERYESGETAESDMYYSEADQEEYESENESKYERETESELNYNTEITENYSESDLESESEPEDNVFKTPTGIPYASKNFAPKSIMKSSTLAQDAGSLQDICVEDTCDATSLSETSSYTDSYVSTDIRSNTGTHQSYASSTSSVGSSCETESLKESEENSTKSSYSSTSDANLCYTVSFYRKQKQETRTTPTQVAIMPKKSVSTPSISDQTEAIQEQIKILQADIAKQQSLIGQASQALNLCIATAEFSGSQEQVEGERLLLMATQKRQALLNEIQRLKTHGAKGECMADGTGTLTISDLQLPLKQEFLAAQLEGRINDAVHWFLCLIRYGAQVIVTQLVSTDDKLTNGALCFTNFIKLQNLPPDFSIVFEVYALQTKKEKLPHEKKYHIKKDKSSIRLTSKSKKGDNKLSTPTISSPGGPNAVRSPSFGVIGFTRFNIQNCHKKCFTLDKVPFTSPLEGILKVQLNLHAEHNVMEKGFLTMFEDVSGLGCWHIRWCSLNTSSLTYWKYPDDENKKVPLGSIDLKQCVTTQVKPVSRDICARPHTFELVTVRPKKSGDKNTLITEVVNNKTTTRHLLSADTKEERILWCNKLNEALLNVRKWDPQVRHSFESN